MHERRLRGRVRRAARHRYLHRGRARGAAQRGEDARAHVAARDARGGAARGEWAEREEGGGWLHGGAVARGVDLDGEGGAGVDKEARGAEGEVGALEEVQRHDVLQLQREVRGAREAEEGGIALEDEGEEPALDPTQSRARPSARRSRPVAFSMRSATVRTRAISSSRAASPTTRSMSATCLRKVAAALASAPRVDRRRGQRDRRRELGARLQASHVGEDRDRHLDEDRGFAGRREVGGAEVVLAERDVHRRELLRDGRLVRAHGDLRPAVLRERRAERRLRRGVVERAVARRRCGNACCQVAAAGDVPLPTRTEESTTAPVLTLARNSAPRVKETAAYCAAGAPGASTSCNAHIHVVEEGVGVGAARRHCKGVGLGDCDGRLRGDGVEERGAARRREVRPSRRRS